MNDDKQAIEKQIIAELYEDSRVSSRKMAEKLSHSTTTISNKMKKLEDNGVIEKFTISVDHEKLGYGITAIINVIVSKKLSEMEVFISKMKGVVAVYDVTGTYDVVVIAKTRDTSELSKLVKDMLEHEHIERTNTQVVLNVVKEDFTLPPLEIRFSKKN
ncbi:MAG: Lrp/AsnC family transcriptional regulator [Candidatus Odinarchaeota archaeon]